jgi:hypothetical protein
MIFVTFLSLIGVALNIKRKRSGFWVWMVTNAIWAGYDYRIGAWEQGVLFTAYFVLACWGSWEWRTSS